MVRLDAATLPTFFNRGSILGYGLNPVSGSLSTTNSVSVSNPDTGVTNWIPANAVMPDYKTLTTTGFAAITGKVDVYIQGAMCKTDGTVDPSLVSVPYPGTRIVTDSVLGNPGLTGTLTDTPDGYRYFRLVFKIKGPPSYASPTWGTVDGINVPYDIR